MRETPKPFEIYQHFKGMLYQIHGVALHSETGERLVVYQQLYAPYGLYVRPIDMFLSEVDHEKYPTVTQKYRFEKIQAPAYEIQTKLGEQPQLKTQSANLSEVEKAEQQITLEQSTTVNEATEESEFNPEIELLTPFFDADTYEEKLEVLISLQTKLTNSMIDTMAICLDVEIKEGDIEARFTELKNCLLTMEHFECNRLR